MDPTVKILFLSSFWAGPRRIGGYEVFDHSYDAVVIGAGGAGFGKGRILGLEVQVSSVYDK